MQNICFEFARALSLALEHPDREGIDFARQRVPFRIVLRAFENRKKQNPALSLFEMIVDEATELLAEPREETEEFVKYCLFSGTAVVLFDGLDEVLNITTRRDYVELVERFSEAFAAINASMMKLFPKLVGALTAILSPSKSLARTLDCSRCRVAQRRPTSTANA